MSNLMKFLKDESGATAIEYALITALIAGAIISVFGTSDSTGLRSKLVTGFSNIGTTITSNTGGSSTTSSSTSTGG